MKRGTLLIITFLVLLFFILSSCSKQRSQEPPRGKAPRECAESWRCGPWSACTNNIQHRTCLDQNTCDTKKDKPLEQRICSTEPQSLPPQEATPPSTPIQPPTELKVSVSLSQEEIVFDYSQERCTEMDLPDVYAHAIRNNKGEIVLVSGNAPDNYFMFGKDFNSLQRNCKPVLKSGNKWEASALDHQEWITSVYSEEGKTIHALVHNEYHDPFASNCMPGNTEPGNPCWYNFISYAQSTDGGYTFTQPPSPSHLVAILPFKWNADAMAAIGKAGAAPEVHGYMEPSNIIKKEEYYYSMFAALVSSTDSTQPGMCVMRTNNLQDPSSWKIWDGKGFNIPLMNPYKNSISNPSQYICAPVSPQIIGDLRSSLTYNTYLQRYMLVGTGVHQHENNPQLCGFWFSLSDDLMVWSKPQLLRAAILGWPPCNQQTPAQQQAKIWQEAYPSIIDHDAPDISFTQADNTFYLYFMQNKDPYHYGETGFDRDLVRVPVTFTKS